MRVVFCVFFRPLHRCIFANGCRFISATGCSTPDNQLLGIGAHPVDVQGADLFRLGFAKILFYSRCIVQPVPDAATDFLTLTVDLGDWCGVVPHVVSFAVRQVESPRVSRRPLGLSHAAISD